MRTLNYKTRFIDLASEINSEMPEYVVRKIARALNDDQRSVKGSRVLILGIAYKRDIDDMRESPALDVMRLLEERGAQVDYHDPWVASFRENGHSKAGVELSKEVLERADAVVVITDHSGVDYQFVADNTRLVVDTRNATSKLKASRARIVPLAAERPDD
jgi:UDP-N-acetyl-D-glucosamine dehydrogenase